MPRRGSILLSTANEIGSALVDKLGGSGYAPVEWDKKINIMGIASEDIPDALDNLIPSEGGGDRGSILISKANEIGAVLNKKFQTERGFKPKEWASAISKLTPLQVKTASGAIASFPDGAEAVPLASLIANIDPKQDLHGYSKPWAPGAGKNKFQNDGFFPKTDSVQSYYFMEFTRDTNTMPEIILVADTTYTLSFDVTSNIEPFRISVGCGDGRYLLDVANKSNLNSGRVSITFTPTATQLASGNILAFRAPRYQQTQTFNYTISNVQLEISASETSFEPYSNVCPISGSTETTAYHYGKNLIDNSKRYQAARTLVLGQTDNTSFSIFLKAGTYTISYTTSATASYIYRREENDTSNTNMGRNTSATFTTAKDGFYRFWLYGDDALNEYISNAQLEVGSAPTSYEAFKQKTPVTVSFGRTVYGGEINVTTGVLTITHGVMTLPETGWTYYAVSGHNTFNCFISGAKTGVLAKCEVYTFEQVSYIAQQSNKCFYFYSSGDNVRISIRDDDYTNATTFGQAIEGYQLVYPLATPIVIDLENPQEVESYLGFNNIYNTTGDTSASYYADIDLDNA